MLADDDSEVHEIVDPRDAAEGAGLVYVSDDSPGIAREKAENGFTYRGPNGKTITNQKVLERIRHLAIPPAYRDVWICPKANGHIQATGRDDKGRKQYRYHAAFREVRESVKFEHMNAFAAALPTIRSTVKTHMALRGLPREKVLATIVYLLETTLIRVGNADYAKTNKSYGLTTLRDPHVEIEGSEIHFEFKGKSKKIWNLHVKDKRVAKIVGACQDLPGQQLFQYLDHEGLRHSVSSQDVNDYLHEITGRRITAKDFRTWAGTVLAALALNGFEAFDSQALAKKNIRVAIENVSSRLGNTPSICRKCYVHPEILKTYLSGELLLEMKQEVDAELRDNLAQLSPEEAAVLAMLETRLGHDLEARDG
ncbi:DNA topoisomerase IB [Lichenifustis flavocetrariae]|uniref:DNA topoisomerase n=1 Tax=Lichenifustis flavocetrariae TaxID=2949735 RepID=A0AA41Z271_9HYPH|nr:DNA topoisomerase IB [Lichenifustis flavocetrariae]MCW6507917.1 DNA topoisomerase IB [Lichenifustis flavocetrariae]